MTRDSLVLPLTGRDGVARDYPVPPLTAGELFDLLALSVPWPDVGQARAERLGDGATDALSTPLGAAVSQRMLADGVSRAGYTLASTVALQWHFAGDAAARELWTTGKVGKAAGPPTAAELDQYGIDRNERGIPRAYLIPAHVQARMNTPPPDEQVTMGKVWAEADLIEADIEAIYGVDIGGPDRDTRTGPWLRKRVETLLLHPASMLAVKVLGEVRAAREAREKAEKGAR